MAALTAGAVVLGGTAVQAEELPEFSLDTVVVTATRTMKELLEVPSSVSVVTAKEIEERNVTSVQEALQYLPGVYMNQAALGGIQMRGFSGTDILFLVDGQQMNSTYNGTVDLNTISVENIERIEVLRGAASSIYGGHAVGGVINIITKEAKEGTHVSAVLSYGSNSTWKKALQINSRVNDNFSFGLGYENKKSDGYKGYFITKSPTTGSGKYTADLPMLGDGKTYIVGGRGEKEWEHKNYNLYLKYNFDDSKSLKYTYTKADTGFLYKNPFSYVKDANGNPVYNGKVTTQNGDVVSLSTSNFYGYDNLVERDTHALMYKDEDNKFTTSFTYMKNKADGYSTATLPSGYTGLDWEGEGHYSSHPGKIYNFDVEKVWDNLGRHTLVAGANFKQEEMIQDNLTLLHWHDHDSVIDHYNHAKGTDKNMALFIQDEYKISEPLTLYMGLRYDHYKKGSGTFWSTEKGYEYDLTSDSATYNEISPKIALDYKADDNTSYYISYGHSFNPPEMYKMYRYTAFSKYWYVPNPELKPETSDTFEIGMRKKLSDKTNLSVTLYHVDTDDRIAASGLLPGQSFHGKPVKKYMNYNQEKRNGIELELNHKFNDKFSGYFNYAWQQGKLKTDGEESNDYNIPKHLLHAGLNYNYAKWNALLDCQYVSEREAPDDIGGYGAEEAYFLVNAAVNYAINKDMTLQFSINNLFDRDFYASEATAGRTYNLGLRYSF